MEAAHRTSLAKGLVGLRDKKPPASLKEFLCNDFRPYVEGTYSTRVNTLRSYRQTIKSLLASDLAGRGIDTITSQDASLFAAQHAGWQKSTTNRALSTLRRALILAVEWGKLDRYPKIELLKGENRRERVLREEEAKAYLSACAQPWRDVATVILGTGACPGEVYSLRWENVDLKERRFVVVKGKTASRRRPLPMVPEVSDVFFNRYEFQKHPSTGWVFPASKSYSGHITQESIRYQHGLALKASGVAHFVPYTLRHTALTWLAPHGDAFALMRIAGHSQLTTTMRYIHPETKTIDQVFNTKLLTDEEKKTDTNGERVSINLASLILEAEQKRLSSKSSIIPPDQWSNIVQEALLSRPALSEITTN